MSKTNAAAARALTSSHFELFGLAPAYALDIQALERAYREIQSRVHPDRFAHAGDAERRASMEMTTRVNEAYRALKDPVQRAQHLLELNGIDVAFETDTAMPADFLMRQMEMRESLEEAKTVEALDLTKKMLLNEKQELETALARKMDVERNFQEARTLVRKLMFFDRLEGEVEDAYEALEG
jgi:molecular chaperone HscB